jgi:hypothetical protein
MLTRLVLDHWSKSNGGTIILAWDFVEHCSNVGEIEMIASYENLPILDDCVLL